MTQTTMQVGDEDIVAQRYEERVPVERLTPHPMNPNRGDLEFIRESIAANGFYGAVLAQESTGRIIAGEHRWRAAMHEGLGTVPVFWKDCTDTEALRIMLVDNEATRRGRNDAEALELCLSELANLDEDEPLAGSGFTLRDLRQIEQGREEREQPEFETQYAVIVECEDEDEQQRVFNSLTELGYTNIRVIAI